MIIPPVLAEVRRVNEALVADGRVLLNLLEQQETADAWAATGAGWAWKRSAELAADVADLVAAMAARRGVAHAAAYAASAGEFVDAEAIIAGDEVATAHWLDAPAV